jgi:predicted GNAT family acetyltransferase
MHKNLSALTDNAKDNRYEWVENGQTVFADYHKSGNTVRILHVEAPETLRGTGAAGRFMQALMEHLRAEKLKAVPICSYAVTWLERHKEFQDIVNKHDG